VPQRSYCELYSAPLSLRDARKAERLRPLRSELLPQPLTPCAFTAPRLTFIVCENLHAMIGDLQMALSDLKLTHILLKFAYL